jgi:hypothetical protein
VWQLTCKTTRRRIGGALAAALAVMVVVAGSGLAATAVKPYVEPVGGEYQVRALFSVDDKVPLLGGAPGSSTAWSASRTAWAPIPTETAPAPCS